jgi:8-amino-7-oxononanoate synthase
VSAEPSRTLLESLASELEALRVAGLERTLTLPQGVDFSSNDYLGLARRPEFHERVARRTLEGPAASPASRLLRGHLELHEQVERRLASWKGTEAALVFATGYQANLGLITALIRPEDRAISDELNHASIIDALRLCRARRAIFAHLDVAALRAELERPHPEGRTFIITESLFSMDGDIAPLDAYADLAEEYGASLIVDDAHATGVYGDARGSGLTETFGVTRRADAIVSTFGKALGCSGAFVAGPRVLIDWLVHRSRPFIFSTAPAPALFHGMETALELVAENPELRSHVLERADELRELLRADSIDCGHSVGPIVPVIVGENDRALTLAESVRKEGFDVRAIRPPSVAPGTARLRVSVHADHTPAEIERLAATIRREFARSRERR